MVCQRVISEGLGVLAAGSKWQFLPSHPLRHRLRTKPDTLSAVARRWLVVCGRPRRRSTIWQARLSHIRRNALLDTSSLVYESYLRFARAGNFVPRTYRPFRLRVAVDALAGTRVPNRVPDFRSA